GVQRGANAALLIRDPSLSLRAGALAAWPSLDDTSPFLPFADSLAKHAGFSLDTPFQEIDPAQQRQILHGTGETWLTLADRPELKFQYKGLFPSIDEASRVSTPYRQRLEHLVDEVPCGVCKGSRLRLDAAAVRFQDRTLGDLGDLPIGQTLGFFRGLKQTK